MVDKNLITTKLDSLMRCVERIETKRPRSMETLLQDVDIQDILVLNIERAVQLCVDICIHWISSSGNPAPQNMAAAFIEAADEKLLPLPLAERLARSVGFRNVAVHQYEKIDWAIVYAIAWNHLDDFRLFSSSILKALEKIPYQD
ncbi:MAG: type VII toxin-antitoxin system HepT family RNase toxin [Rectinema subterraneum]|uniref:type VII toxin-antitoxin system HepT family RNase toxin n=1 Tax=Rectinema subterraneum TaxID=2653714 RepID=UPI003C7A5E72